MRQIFEVNSSLTAKLVSCMLCDCKMNGEVQSIANDSAIKNFYKTLSQRQSQICREYSLLSFVKLVKSLKTYLEDSHNSSILKDLLDHNIALFNYSKEVRECHKILQKDVKWLEIKDIHNVALIDNQYVYIEDGEEYVLNEAGMIVRPSDPSFGDVILYIGSTNEEMKKKTGATRPARGFYAIECGVNYFGTRDITVKRWYSLDDEHKQYTKEEDEF